MSDDLKNSDWNLLLRRIQRGECTPILGTEASFASRLSAADIAQQWASEYEYPLGDSNDLARVAQFVSITAPSNPKELILDLISDTSDIDTADLDAPYSILADLPLPLYITTNYDDQFEQALIKRNRRPRRTLWVWNEAIEVNKARILRSGFDLTIEECTVETPVVFHLYGHCHIPESLVLTEDDYLDFIMSVSSGQYTLPPRILEALSGTSLVFIGYHLGEWSFRILLRGINAAITASLQRLNVTVQLPPLPHNAPEQIQRKAQEYLYEYFQRKQVRGVYWGTPQAFVADLRHRWQDLNPQSVIGPISAGATEELYDTRIREQIMMYFNLEELHTLCVDLQVEFENLAGATLEAKARELVMYSRRHGLFGRLVTQCRRSRPQGSW